MKVKVRDGKKLHVRVFGQGQQQVLMLHGLGMKSAHWLPFIWSLRKQYTFYMPDFRGHGGSAAISVNQLDVFQQHCDDVEDIVESLGLHDFYLVGYSLGGTTSLHWQNAGGWFYPTGQPKVKAYLQIDQTPCVPNRDDWQYGLFGKQQSTIFAELKKALAVLEKVETKTVMDMPLAQRRELMDILGTVFVDVLGKKSVRPILSMAGRFPFLLSSLLPITRIYDLKAYLTSYTQLGRDYLPAIKDCAVPVTVMIGAKSPLYAEAGQRALAQTVQHGKVVLLRRSGHVPLMDQPLAFGRALRQFLGAK